METAINPVDESAPEFRVSVGMRLDEVERRLIVATLYSTKGNIMLAARTIGITAKTIYNKLARYGLSPETFDTNGRA